MSSGVLSPSAARVAGGLGRGALVHEWIAQAGGSENVLSAFKDIFTDADVLCLWNDSVGRFDPAELTETWLARTPLRRSKIAALPLMPLTWRRLPNRGYDWALISTHLFAHHARFRGQSDSFRRFVYVHTPARYVWTPELDGRGTGGLSRTVAAALKPIDRRRAQEGGDFAANSAFVADRMRSTWEVEARVIFPPVEVEEIQAVSDWSLQATDEERRVLDGLPEGFLLGASRFIPYKRLELVIAAGEACGRPVVLAGKGPELAALQARAAAARVPVHVLIAPSTPMLRALYQRTALFVFPAVEDFGIMPVEAMAAGAPVLAQAVGGTAESVVPGRTGELITFADSGEFAAGAERAMQTEREDRLARARDFSRQRFTSEVLRWVGGG